MNTDRKVSWVFDSNGHRIEMYESGRIVVVNEDGSPLSETERARVEVWYRRSVMHRGRRRR